MSLTSIVWWAIHDPAFRLLVLTIAWVLVLALATREVE